MARRCGSPGRSRGGGSTARPAGCTGSRTAARRRRRAGSSSRPARPPLRASARVDGRRRGVPERDGDPFQARRAGRLHQHDVAGPQLVRSSIERGIRVGTHVDSPFQEPSRAAPCAIGRAASPTAMSRDMSSRTASRPIASCSAAASAPSSAIGPSTATVRAGAGPADRGQRLQRGPHRLRIGVVGVVDDDHAVGALGQLHPPARPRTGCRQGLRDGGQRIARTRARRPRRRARCRRDARRRAAA